MFQLTPYLEKYPFVRDRILPLIASPTRRRLASGAFWAGVGGVISRGSILVTSFLLARILGQTHFGEYGVINSTSAMLSAVAGLGVGATATKYVAELRNTDKERAGKIIALSRLVTWISGTIYGIIFVVLASWLAENTLAAPHLANILRISSISVALGVINGAQQCSLAGFEAFKATAFINIGCGLIQSIAVCAGAYYGGVQGAIISMAFSTGVMVVATWLVLRNEMERYCIKNWWHGAWVEWPVLVKFSLPAFLTTMIVGPVFWGCSAMLANQPGGYNELGIFNAANQWYAAVLFLPGLFTTAALPVLAERYGVDKGASNQRIMIGLMLATAVVVIPLVLILSLFSKLIMHGYGETFENGYYTFILSVLAAGVHAIVTPCWYVMMARDRMWTCFIMNFGFSLVFICGTLGLIGYGAVGLAGSRLIAYAFHGIWLLGYTMKASK